MPPKRDAERRRRVFRAFMEERGLKAASWAKRAGIKPEGIYNFLNGHSFSLSSETMDKLALAEGVPVEVLTGDTPTVKVASAIYVIGKVQAGLWQEAAEWPQDDWEIITIPLQGAYRQTAYGLKVDGPSMNRYYPEGSIAVCVKLSEFHRDLRDGDRVICHRTRRDGSVEATVKEMTVDEAGKMWLWPRSFDPRFQKPVNFSTQPDTEQVEIIAVVIGAYIPSPSI